MEWIGSRPFPANKTISLPTWQIAKTVQNLKLTSEIAENQDWRHAGSGLGLAGCHISKNKWDCQIDLASYVHDIHAKICRYRWMISSPFPHHTSFVASGKYDGPDVPAVKFKFNKGKASEWKQARRQLEVLHLFRCSTHTCSEQSLRILMWNATDVQKTLQLNLTRRMKIIYILTDWNLECPGFSQFFLPRR